MSTSKQAEQNALDGALGSVAGALANLSPFAKAIVPAALGLATALVNWLVTGTFDSVSITSAAGGLVTAVVVYEVPNKPAPVAPGSVTPVTSQVVATPPVGPPSA